MALNRALSCSLKSWAAYSDGSRSSPGRYLRRCSTGCALTA